MLDNIIRKFEKKINNYNNKGITKGYLKNSLKKVLPAQSRV